MRKPRGRPKKPRIVKQKPHVIQFSPRGRPGRPDEVELGLEEYEAVRLVDYRGLDQHWASINMGISQQTFSRVLKRARKALAEGLVRGAIIRIDGGTYTFRRERKRVKVRHAIHKNRVKRSHHK